MKPAAGIFVETEMDIITHAIVGAASGAVFGHPIVGAIVAVIPDIPLGITRKHRPNIGYDMLHSPVIGGLNMFNMANIFLGMSHGAPTDFSFGWAALLAWASHIFLDLFTHGPTWAPMPFAPISFRRVSLGYDWELFDSTWWNGLLLAICWVLACLAIIAL